MYIEEARLYMGKWAAAFCGQEAVHKGDFMITMIQLMEKSPILAHPLSATQSFSNPEFEKTVWMDRMKPWNIMCRGWVGTKMNNKTGREKQTIHWVHGYY